jgi:hypothetical protein
VKIFYCDACGALVFFENTTCLKCGHALGFLPDILDVSALEKDGENWRALSSVGKNSLYRSCTNGVQHQVCNWLVPVEDPNPLCASCRLTQTIPDLSVPENPARWFKVEQAKRRAIYTLLQFQLPLTSAPEENRPSLQFRFLGDPAGGPPVMTGHENGIITLNIIEADDAEREKRRVSLHEPYRTLLGHFRHEIGHYFWDRLIVNTTHLNKYRELFGDETVDYSAALKNYYAKGPAPDWQTHFISAYASAHPWEDWAETWAHYLHMADTIETAAGFGMSLTPKHPDAKAMTVAPKRIAANNPDFDTLIKNWLPLTYTLNSLSRGLGYADLYPFALSNPAIEKLRFVHKIVNQP